MTILNDQPLKIQQRHQKQRTPISSCRKLSRLSRAIGSTPAVFNICLMLAFSSAGEVPSLWTSLESLRLVSTMTLSRSLYMRAYFTQPGCCPCAAVTPHLATVVPGISVLLACAALCTLCLLPRFQFLTARHDRDTFASDLAWAGLAHSPS